MLQLKRIGTIAAVAATAALPASAAAQPEIRQDLRMPDTRDAAERYEPKIRQDLRMPDTRDAANHYDPAPSSTPTVIRIVEPQPSGGFDWSDAGLGAAGGLALVTVAGGLGLAVAQRHRVRPA